EGGEEELTAADAEDTEEERRENDTYHGGNGGEGGSRRKGGGLRERSGRGRGRERLASGDRGMNARKWSVEASAGAGWETVRPGSFDGHRKTLPFLPLFGTVATCD